ncbi:MAG: hypothetical protein E6J90_12630 [Deltaproteobacteria bacterium]|nr:MAG: hypothetical protein E6J91_51145 [Deltaproteobacteria bacterium]TMQ22349.1 MAG: hypothetical protein E6J90_12630 [Deltaproteobacteria bacterium]
MSLLLLITGCAETALVVPDSDWRTVPAAQRDAIDRRNEAELVAARAELNAATASLAALQRAPAPPRVTPARAPAPANDDVLADLAREQDRARGEALGRVNAATDEKQRRDLAWRRLRVEEAGAQIDMIIAKRELARAQTIDRYMPGNDSYDTAPLRGQFSRAQQRWYAIARNARAARDAFEHASAELASAKEAYAQLMRGGPIRLADADAEAHARFELPGWSITRRDIRRRRGLHHFLALVEPGATPLSKAALQLSPAPRIAPAPAAKHSASPAPPTVAPAANNPPGDAIRGNPKIAGHPADRAGDASPPASKPAVARSAPVPAPAVIEHPADRAGRASPATAASAGQAAAPRTATGHAIEPPSATTVLAGKPGESRAKPAAAPASSASSPSKPAAPQSSGAPTSAAKPVERPLSDGGTRTR